MADLTTLNRVRYAGLDFQTSEDEILSRLQINFAATYNDFSIASLGIMLLDIVSFASDTMSFYLDRRATDLFLTTGRSDRSVARAARQLGYKMAPATAASVDVQVSPTVAQAFIIPLPIGFQIKSPDGSIWEASQSYSWPISNTAPQTLTFSQTQTLQTIFSSDGTPNQVFKIANVPNNEFLVGPGSDAVSQIIVTINNEDWTEAELLTFGSTNQFEIGYHDSPPTLRFGDGVAGNIPPANTQVRVTFKSSRGTQGRVTSGQKMSVVVPLSINFTPINFNLTIPTGSTAGSLPETIEKAKASAPTFFKSRGVNITKEDYNIRAGTYVDSVFGSIAVASAISVRGATGDAALQTFIDEIVAVSDQYVSNVTSSVNTAQAALTTASSTVADITTDNSNITSDISTATLQATSLSTAAADAITASSLSGTYVTQIITNLTTLSTSLAVIPSGGSDALTSSTRSALNAIVSLLQGIASQTNLQVSLTTSDITTIQTSIKNIQIALSAVTTQQANMSTSLTSISNSLTGAGATLSALVVTVNGLDNNVADIGAQISAHVGSFLSSDCQSNLIEVPILALDSDGFYIGPTIALIKSLQDSLDAKKELTQVVRVVSGASQLIPAVVSAHVKVLPGYLESTLRSKVEAAILTVLKNRAFGKSLDISELYWVVAPNTINQIPGVFSVAILINGPVNKLDGSGNLVILENEVVTRGSITMTSEVVPRPVV